MSAFASVAVPLPGDVSALQPPGRQWNGWRRRRRRIGWVMGVGGVGEVG
jgi:hypothetical protein